MKKHFCTCTLTDCKSHPYNHNKGCDPCIQKNLKLGEIPACFWANETNGIEGESEYSTKNFVKFYLERKS